MPITLKEIVSVFKAGLSHIDRSPPPPTQMGFIPSVSTLSEDTIRDHLLDYFAISELEKCSHMEHEKNSEVKYPNQPKNGRGRCDLCLGEPPDFEWAIEIKYIRYVGDNGKKNDFGPSKVVSPYLIHNSAIKDALRLTKYPLAKRSAVIMFGFDYDMDVVKRGRKLLDQYGLCSSRCDELEKVLRANDQDTLTYYTEPTFRMFENVAQDFVSLSRRENDSFEGFRHPVAQKGSIAAWEIMDKSDNQNLFT